MEREGPTADFAQVRQRGDAPKPEFVRGAAIIGRRSSEVHEVRSGKKEFVPEGSWSIACKAHGTRLPVNRSVEMLHSSILRGRIGGGGLVINAKGAAPV